MVKASEGRKTPDDQMQIAVSVGQLRAIHRDLDACQRVIWLAGVRPRGYGFDPAYCTDAQARLNDIEALIESARGQTEQQHVEVMCFQLKHPDTGDTHTVMLNRSEVADGMDDTIFEKLGDLICDCQPAGETNVVECNCDDYIYEFELANAAPVLNDAIAASPVAPVAQIDFADRVAELEAQLGQQHEAHRKTWRQLEQAQAELAALKAGGSAHG